MKALETSKPLETSSSPALDRFYGVIVRILDYIDNNAELLSCMSRIYTSKKTFLPRQRPLTARVVQILEQLLDQACRQGEIKEIDVSLTTNFLFAALGPDHFLYHRDALGYSKERYLAGIHRIFIEGLQKR